MRTPRACTIEGCGRQHYARGCCTMHYSRWLRRGNTSTPISAPMKFLRETAILYQETNCLIWPFKRDRHGYGIVSIKNRHHVASRMVCKLVHGEPPAPKYTAAHSCGNGKLGCVNPLHLSWKTQKENLADCLIHGTRNFGTRNGSNKLMEDDIRKIRALKGTMFQREIADQFGITRRTVGDILSGRIWSWLS